MNGRYLNSFNPMVDEGWRCKIFLYIYNILIYGLVLGLVRLTIPRTKNRTTNNGSKI